MVVLCVKTYCNTAKTDRISKNNLSLLQEAILIEEKKHHFIHEKNLLADNLNNGMMISFLRIIREVILILNFSLNKKI
jgi:hypothetical protein